MIRFLRWLFRKPDYKYHPVSQWLEQGESGYHLGDWGRR